MPCRSRRASISSRPRESLARSRRPSDTNGGTTGLLGFRAGGDGADLAGAAGGFTDADAEEGPVTGAFASDALVCEILACDVLARRDFLRNGLVCLATLSHSARS